MPVVIIYFSEIINNVSNVHVAHTIWYVNYKISKQDLYMFGFI